MTDGLSPDLAPDILHGDSPKINMMDAIEDVGVYATLALLSRNRLPAYTVPRREDYGLDIIVQVTRPGYDMEKVVPGNTSGTPHRLAERIARVTGAQPSHHSVIGSIFAMQVKTSGEKYKSGGDWTFPVEPRHSAYWSNCPFPVILVLCDSRTSELRWANVTDWLTQNPTGTHIKVTERLDDDAIANLTRRAMESAARVRANDWLHGLFMQDAESQLRGVVAVASYPLEMPKLRALTSRLFDLESEVFTLAARFLIGLEVFVEETASEVDHEEGDEEVVPADWINRFVPQFPQASLADLESLCRKTTTTTIHGSIGTYISVATGTGDEKVTLSVTPDRLASLPDGELKNRASKILDAFLSYSPTSYNQLVTEVIARQSEPEVVLVELSDTDALDHWVSDDYGTWGHLVAWADFIARVAPVLRDVQGWDNKVSDDWTHRTRNKLWARSRISREDLAALIERLNVRARQYGVDEYVMPDMAADPG